MTRLFLIRHGENEYTRQGKLAGWTPAVHLNETGKAQAQALAEKLKAEPFKAIYSSPLERALETAQPLAKQKKLAIQKLLGVGEVRYGDWTGKSLKVLARTKLWQVVQKQPAAMQFPNGEALRETQWRAVNALERVCALHPKETIAVFSHGDIIKLALAYYLGIPLDLFQRLVINTAGISVVQRTPQGIAVLRLNEVPVALDEKRVLEKKGK